MRLTSALLATLALAVPAQAAPQLVKVGDFHAPVHVAAPPNDPRLFVVQQDGQVIVLEGDTRTRYLDLRTDTLTDASERGLLSIAFAPDFATSGKLYVYLTAEEAPGDLLVLEFRQSAVNRNLADPTTRRELLRITHPLGNHNGGQLAFGPDGKLYAGTGDGGAANDPPGNAQNDTSRLGKLLRIDTATGAVETWAKGLRNPWRFSFDRQTSDLLIADVGQNAFEEINLATAAQNHGRGSNYGWDCYEGLQATGECTLLTQQHHAPFYVLGRSTGACAITGGFVVRDGGLPTLAGRYLYGDNCLEDLYSITPGGQDNRREIALDGVRPTSFGEDALGRLYVASIPGYAHAPGAVYRIVDPAAGGGGGGQPPPTGGSPPAACAPRVLALRAQRPLRRGLLVRVRTAAACAVTVTARLGRRIRFRSVTRPAREGDRALRLRLSPRSKARLRRALARRSRLVTVTVRASGPAGVQRASRRLRVRR